MYYKSYHLNSLKYTESYNTLTFRDLDLRAPNELPSPQKKDTNIKYLISNFGASNVYTHTFHLCSLIATACCILISNGYSLTQQQRPTETTQSNWISTMCLTLSIYIYCK